MYEDEKDEVIHDTDALDKRVAEIQTDDAIVKQLRALVQQEIAKRFDEQPTSYNSFKQEEVDQLVDSKLENFLHNSDFETRVIDISRDECKDIIENSTVDISTTGYISY